MVTLKQRTITGIGWSTVGSFSKQGVQFVLSVILARLLTPEDFGLLGMVLVFTGLAILFNDLGFGAALIQKRALKEQHLSSVFWLNLGVGFLLTILMIALAPFIASFYNEPQLVLVVRAMAMVFFVGALGVVPRNIFSRHMQFKVLVSIDFLAVFLAGIIAIILALLEFGVWSLVGQLLSFTVISVFLLWIRSHWRPRFILQWQALRELWPFSSNLLGAQLLNYGVRNVDYLLIGRFIGSGELGIYTRAYTTMLLPINQITAVVGRVMFPALSQIQDDIPKVKHVYLYANRIIALLTMPLMLGLLVVAKPFVLALFGPKWEAVIPVLQILCLVGLKQPIGSTVGWIYQSQGRTNLMFRWSIFAFVVTIISFFIGIRWGVVGVAAAYAVGNYLIWYPSVEIPGRLIDMSFKEFIVNVAGIFGCALGMALIVWALGTRFPSEWPNWLQLLIQVAVGVVVYWSLIHIFRVRAYSETKSLFLEQWHNRRVVTVPKI
ncbi:MAG: MOP flippase family protein [Chloroflexi bacterium]|nr:MOP flippase family protein [Chloroflexota bacterium]